VVTLLGKREAEPCSIPIIKRKKLTDAVSACSEDELEADDATGAEL